MRRRKFLKLSALGASAPLIGSAFDPVAALAKPDHIVVMTWGGEWGNAMRDNVGAAFTKETGVKVIQDRSSTPVQRITKLKISLSNQTTDLVQIHDGIVPLAIKQGVVEKLDRNSPRMPNLRNMIPQFWNDYWVPMIFSVIGVTYNVKEVKTPPTGFADLWRKEFAHRIVLPDISHSIGPYIIPIGAMAAGKSPKDVDAGFEMLKRMADLQPIWAKDTDTIMHDLQDGEALIGLLYKSQTWTVKDRGGPVEWVYPKEGGIPYLSGTSIAKNTKNKDLAETYLNVTMDPNVQTFVTKKFNYAGTNKDEVSKLPTNLQQRVQFSKEQLAHLVQLDHEYMSEHRAEWTEKWNRIVAGG